MNRAFACLLSCVLMLLSRTAFAGQAQDTVRTAVDDVLLVLHNSRQGEPGRLDRLAQVVSKVFDPEELARRTLASHWQGFSPEEQKVFTAAFIKLLQNTYIRRMEAYTDEKIEFIGESELAENRAEVSSKIISSNKDIAVIYRLVKNGDWKVYDVIIEGVSLVQNYRNQFAQMLAKESPAQLIARINAMANSN